MEEKVIGLMVVGAASFSMLASVFGYQYQEKKKKDDKEKAERERIIRQKQEKDDKEKAQNEVQLKLALQYREYHVDSFKRHKNGRQRARILVIGLQHSGKSSVINTLFSITVGSFKRECETSPSTGFLYEHKTVRVSHHTVPETQWTIMDTPGFNSTEIDKLPPKFIEACILGVAVDSTVDEITLDNSNQPNCVLVVCTPEQLLCQDNDILVSITKTIDKFRNPKICRRVTVLTHWATQKIENSIDKAKQLTNTDDVYFVENFTNADDISSVLVWGSHYRLWDRVFSAVE